MRLLLSLGVLVVTLGVLQSALDPHETKTISEETLKRLSQDGQRLVEEELKKALSGVKQLREVMWRNEQKHEHLMKSLQRSSDKKKGASQLSREVMEKLMEAEEQCQVSLQSEWEECRPCLELACKDFYTSTCRRGFATFHTKVGNFFRRVSKRLGSQEKPQLESRDILVNQDSSDSEVNRIEESFTHLMTKVGSMVNRSKSLVSQMKDRLDQSFQASFMNNTPSFQAEEDLSDPLDLLDPGRDSGYLQGMGLDEVLDSFFDFGRSVVEEFGAVVTQVFGELNDAVEEKKKKERESLPHFLLNGKLCRALRKQTSECWQLQSQCEACQGALLTECPSVRELHVELDEVSQLLDASQEQYEEIRSIVRRHVEETLYWIMNIASEVSWVSLVPLAPPTNSSSAQNIFRVTKVAPDNLGEALLVQETKVEVNILNSSLILSVPGELQLHDPAFIEYVTSEALDKYKDLVRFEDD